MSDPAVSSYMGETLVGALVGAAVGSILGYIGSYHLARRSRHEDVEERRKRLMRVLSHEILLEVKDLEWGSTLGGGTISTGVYLATLTPLLDLVADLDDDTLLTALAALRSRSDSFNDVVAWTNALQTRQLNQAEVDHAMSIASQSYRLVKDAAELVVPMLEIPR